MKSQEMQREDEIGVLSDLLVAALGICQRRRDCETGEHVLAALHALHGAKGIGEFSAANERE